MQQVWGTTSAEWRDYYVKRWERAGRDSLLQLALFYQFLHCMETDPEVDP